MLKQLFDNPTGIGMMVHRPINQRFMDKYNALIGKQLPMINVLSDLSFYSYVQYAPMIQHADIKYTRPRYYEWFHKKSISPT